MTTQKSDNTPALEHVMDSLSEQMASSQKVLQKLRHGASLYPRLSIMPAILAILCVWFELGVWAIVLSIAATSALLVGALTYTLVERRLVRAIRKAVHELDALTEQDRESLLSTWLG